MGACVSTVAAPPAEHGDRLESYLQDPSPDQGASADAAKCSVAPVLSPAPEGEGAKAAAAVAKKKPVKKYPTREQRPLRIAILGSGNWGSAVAKLVGENAAAHEMFEEEVQMWVYEEEWDGGKLSEFINEKHENPKYLPGVALPPNIVANTSLEDTANGADIILFITPHQFLDRICDGISSVTKETAVGVTLIKGMFVNGESCQMTSQFIEAKLGIRMAALSGANVAKGVGAEEFAEATIGHASDVDGEVMGNVFRRPYFGINTVEDTVGVQCGGAFKNVVALAAGFIDGMDLGANTKSACLRAGMAEMMKLAKVLYPTIKEGTFFESCGMADLITTCFAGRNRKCAEAFARAWPNGDWAEIEKDLLNGQKLQGTLCCREIHEVVRARGLEAEFPFFMEIHDIAFGGAPLARFLEKVIEKTQARRKEQRGTAEI